MAYDQEQLVPAILIIEIVKTNPKNLQELSQIKGFNYSKRYEKYGQDIIDLLNN